MTVLATRSAPASVVETTTKTSGSSARNGTKALQSAIEVIASFVSEFEPSRYSGEDAAALVSWFTRAERVCGAGKTLAATRAAESNRHQGAGHRSAAEWLAGVTGESVGEAVDVLKLGETLEAQPGVDEAFRHGRLSRSRAKLVAGAVKVNPRSEQELLKGAQDDTFRQLKDRCLRAKSQGRSKEDEARAYEAIRQSRHCRTWTDADGAFRLDAKLTPDAGASLLASLKAESNRYFERARKAGLYESGDAYAADALVALIAGQRSVAADRKDPNAGGRPPGAKATVHLRVDLDALRRGSVSDGEICEIPGVGPVPIATARDLMGDAITDVVITNGVDVSTICHLGRSIRAPLRTALIERDRTCVVPGCDVAEGLEIDHWGVSFAKGGPTCLENLARLCGHHHYLRTHQGFELTGGPGRWRWHRPNPPLVAAQE